MHFDADTKNVDSKVVRRLNHKVELIVIDKDRIIVDDVVYKSKDMLLPIFQFTVFDMVSGLSLADDKICMGHNNYAKMSIWKWTGSSYELIVKKPMLHSN